MTTYPVDSVENVRSSVRRMITRHDMVRAGELVVVGVSGGPDSMCLLDCLIHLASDFGMRLWVGHLHHGMRGADADRDARMVSEFASGRGIPVTVGKRDVPALARIQGVGLEEAGRIARYSFLRELAGKVGAAKIATAHNRNDQAETVLMRLFRGSGAAGLAGIPPVRDGIVRPLLEVTRAEIEEYVRERNLPVTTDVYNFDMRYVRNKLRHELIPMLSKEFNPAIVDVVSDTATLLRWDEEFLDEQASRAFYASSFSEGRITYVSTEALLSQPLALSSRMVRKAFADVLREPRTPESRRVLSFLYSLKERTQKLYDLGMGVRARDEGDFVAFFPPAPKNVRVELEVPGFTPVPELGVSVRTWLVEPEEALSLQQEILRGETHFTRGVPSTCLPHMPAARRGCDLHGSFCTEDMPGRIFLERRVFLDYNKLQAGLSGKMRLLVRNRRPGDKMKPLGMRGSSKKLQDLFVSAGLFRWYRDFIPIIERQGDIVWVAGIRLDERFKVDAETRVLLGMEIEPSLRHQGNCANIGES
ncbi:MAG TPA: tRNA lysidine(34) synthetase TilS [Firmicutes bacterium]|nr:tRNA lysidine(34) synthetase TilS [Candidatus Fermentithermobacillaceae bacterium]